MHTSLNCLGQAVQVLEQDCAAQGFVVCGNAIFGDEQWQSQGGKPFKDRCQTSRIDFPPGRAARPTVVVVWEPAGPANEGTYAHTDAPHDGSGVVIDADEVKGAVRANAPEKGAVE
jgi:hypothetical protein